MNSDNLQNKIDMKRLYYLLLVMMIVGIVSCGNDNKKETETPEAEATDIQVSNEDSIPVIVEQKATDLSKCDMVMLDMGKMFFYNSQTQTLIPYETETDSVVNTIFVDDKLYYCVPENGMVILKSIALNDSTAFPVKECDWGLKYEKCVTETYGTVSPLEYYAGRHTLGLWHEFSWDSYSMTQQKLFNLDTRKVTDWDYETWQEEEQAQLAEEEEQTEENYHFEPMEDELREYLTMQEDNYWLVDGIEHVCLTDKIDFSKYVSDPDYASNLDFNYISSSPDNLKVLYMAILEWGDYPHGILAVSSTDGKLQIPLEDTDCTGYIADWLDDGSLVYVGEAPLPADDPDANASWHYRSHCVKRIYPDGHVEIIAPYSDFQVRKP